MRPNRNLFSEMDFTSSCKLSYMVVFITVFDHVRTDLQKVSGEAVEDADYDDEYEGEYDGDSVKYSLPYPDSQDPEKDILDGYELEEDNTYLRLGIEKSANIEDKFLIFESMSAPPITRCCI